ncbi:MAG TPA: SDR family NAD(P)-dependent oxidoreductase [Solirubrobacteraceae bacterium]|jgi:NAD(P)-dependent dehydrogenase (short-subunit alcohol dehydrogenase family)
MTQERNRSILITGANTGLGKDVARQLAQRPEFGRIYLGSRNLEKARRAQSDLETVTGRSIFTVVVLDLSDLASVRAAVEAITEPIDALAMNAGGTGGPTPAALTPDGVTEMFAQNVLGHVVLLEELLAAGMLTEIAVLTGSEAARGVPKLRIPRPVFTDSSVDEFTSVMDGSFFNDRKYNRMLSYGQVKYLGALWIAAMASRSSGLRFVTMSPGNTAGTEALRDQPAPLRTIAGKVLLPYVMPALGLGHKLEYGAGRLVRAVTDPSLQDGVFYASAANTITGPVLDQAEIVPELRDPAVQDHAYEAIHRFVTEPAVTRRPA